MLDRKMLMSEFWKTAKDPALHHTGNHYSYALHHVFNLIEGERKMKNFFVPVSSALTRREVTLSFDSGACSWIVNGIKVATLVGNQIVLEPYVSSEVTGLAVDSSGHVLTRKR